MRYIILEERLGVFIGSYRKLALFAKNDVFGFTKVFSFENRKDAEEYLELFSKDEDYTYEVAEVETDGVYVKVEDLIKQGYGKYTHYMMDSIPMISEATH